LPRSFSTDISDVRVYDLDKIINTLEKDSLNLIDWLTSNQMKVNPDKFQAIAIGKNTQSKNISFNLNGNVDIEGFPYL
jgi:hypothetical protein